MSYKFCLDWGYTKIGTVKWFILCSYKVKSGLQVTNIQLENKAYMLCLPWDFGYDKITWVELMRSVSIINICFLTRH